MAEPRHRSAEAAHGFAGHLREVGGDSHYSSVAAELYETRTRLGLDITDIANELRIRPDQLAAIEEGRFGDLPGPAYAVGFIRSYAGYLGLDAASLVHRFKAEEIGFDARQDLNFPAPYDEGRVPTGPLVAMALVLAVVAYAGWYYVTSVDRSARGPVPEPPAQLAQGADMQESLDASLSAALAEGPEAKAAQAESPPVPAAETAEAEAPSDGDAPAPRPAAEVDGARVAAADPAPEPVPATAAAPEAEPAPAEAAVPATAETQPAPAADAAPAVEVEAAVPAPAVEADGYVPRVFGQGNADARIRIKARRESWVQVTGADNELLLTRILRPGDVYLVPDRPGLVLMTGNAGGIDVIVGDRAAPALGPVGAVRRRVALDPERLLAGTAVER